MVDITKIDLKMAALIYKPINNVGVPDPWDLCLPK